MTSDAEHLARLQAIIDTPKPTPRRLVDNPGFTLGAWVALAWMYERREDTHV